MGEGPVMVDARAERKGVSRGRILDSAGALIREKGICGASVAEVMEGAGMTVGGFYAHFPSKSTLVAEALKEAMRSSRAVLAAGAGGRKGAEWVSAVARSYLSRQHRDRPQAGCPLPSVLGEAAREDPAVREALAGEIGESAGEIALHLEEAGQADPRGTALAVLSTMVGGLTLARALGDRGLSGEVLVACRRHIESSLSP